MAQLRVLSVNICAISPGGHMGRYTVQFLLLGFAICLAATLVLLRTHPDCDFRLLLSLLVPLLGVGTWLTSELQNQLLRLKLGYVGGSLVGGLGLSVAVGTARAWKVPLALLAPLACTLAFVMAPHVAQLLALLSLALPSISEQHKKERLDLLLEHMKRNEYDVVALQELSCYWAHPGHDENTVYLLQGAAQLGYVHVFRTSSVPGKPLQYGSSGLALLSKFRIVDGSARWKPFAHQAWFEASLLTRGMLYAEILLPCDNIQEADALNISITVAHNSSGLSILLDEFLPITSGTNKEGGVQAIEWAEFLHEVLQERHPAAGRSTERMAGKAAGGGGAAGNVEAIDRDHFVIAAGDLNMGPGASSCLLA